MEKNHLEILLEDIQSTFNLVLEGHEALRSEIHDARQESNEQHDQTRFLLKALNKKIDSVADNLAAQRADTEAHSLYMVRE